MPDELRHLNDSYSEGVTLRDGRPVRYWALGPPRTKDEEPAIAARILAVTGYRVRFGAWEEVVGDPRDGGTEVDLFIED
jgi:hypothetical protein